MSHRHSGAASVAAASKGQQNGLQNEYFKLRKSDSLHLQILNNLAK